jgi:hypothetical protein
VTERGIFDVRLHITSDDPGQLYRLAEELADRAREIAPAGVTVLDARIRGYRGGDFIPTVEPPGWMAPSARLAPRASRHGSGKRGRRRR